MEMEKCMQKNRVRIKQSKQMLYLNFSGVYTQRGRLQSSWKTTCIPHTRRHSQQYFPDEVGASAMSKTSRRMYEVDVFSHSTPSHEKWAWTDNKWRKKVSQTLVETMENERERTQISPPPLLTPSQISRAVKRLSSPKDTLDIYQTDATALKRSLPVIWGAAGVHSAVHLRPLCICI